MFRNYKKKPVISAGPPPPIALPSTLGQSAGPVVSTVVVESPSIPTAPTPPSRSMTNNLVPSSEERPLPKAKSAKKKKKRTDSVSSRPPTAAKSAASKGKLHHIEGSRKAV
jgi:hypothetical protein